MREFIAANIMHDKDRLKAEAEPVNRAVLLKVLTEEEAVIAASNKQMPGNTKLPTRLVDFQHARSLRSKTAITNLNLGSLGQSNCVQQ
jgi:hypothetical protein